MTDSYLYIAKDIFTNDWVLLKDYCNRHPVIDHPGLIEILTILKPVKTMNRFVTSVWIKDRIKELSYFGISNKRVVIGLVQNGYKAKPQFFYERPTGAFYFNVSKKSISEVCNATNDWV